MMYVLKLLQKINYETLEPVEFMIRLTLPLNKENRIKMIEMVVR